jgi:hypothetical protein
MLSLGLEPDISDPKFIRNPLGIFYSSSNYPANTEATDWPQFVSSLLLNVPGVFPVDWVDNCIFIYGTAAQNKNRCISQKYAK